MKIPAVYIMTNKRNGALYTAVTANLPKRVYEHKQQITEGFTKKYNCTLLVYFEICSKMDDAITREKQIKAGSRIYKVGLIEEKNPYWRDLYGEIV
ncbi:MAG: GIY-YIG nuclease family protein [Candidatus Nitrohelix vancouverensis]|uniref:GIY-YIG nuclease family protein n=1 Tax=Candidatus Nitrohelix vancouverensis TaxID=2705534 RepID=A0A7T0C108_9BACT|nr:MAG: GIY-YIG nuclease family protein [Candidatus Nitrohelix vancouverensis]